MIAVLLACATILVVIGAVCWWADYRTRLQGRRTDVPGPEDTGDWKDVPF
ncbi:MAG: hypothetical protein OXH96_05515 [Spirochaetaceae bacterium]|nr:hypothetical protein [Spirochaetaceae bacterium]